MGQTEDDLVRDEWWFEVGGKAHSQVDLNSLQGASVDCDLDVLWSETCETEAPC